MKLTATVITLHSASEFTDGRARVTVKVAEADNMDNKLKLRNADGLALDDEVVLLGMPKGDADALYEFLTEATSDYALPPALASLLGQLRPDALPPWEQPKQAGEILDEIIAICRKPPQVAPDTADTQEFVREV